MPGFIANAVCISISHVSRLSPSLSLSRLSTIFYILLLNLSLTYTFIYYFLSYTLSTLIACALSNYQTPSRMSEFIINPIEVLFTNQQQKQQHHRQNTWISTFTINLVIKPLKCFISNKHIITPLVLCLVCLCVCISECSELQCTSSF